MNELLARHTMTAPAATSGVIVFQPRDLLRMQIRLDGIVSASDILAMRVQGDSSMKYCTRYLTWAAGGAVAANHENTSDSMFQLGAVASQGKVGSFDIFWASAVNCGTVESLISTGAVGTPPVLTFGGGFWLGVAQLTQVELICVAGSTFVADIAIFGSPA
jgi:hypothetical protein